MSGDGVWDSEELLEGELVGWSSETTNLILISQPSSPVPRAWAPPTSLRARVPASSLPHPLTSPCSFPTQCILCTVFPLPGTLFSGLCMTG